MYKADFEAPFINATEKYYTAESDAFLQSNTVSDYLKKAEERLREEEDRVERYLNGNTRKIVSLAWPLYQDTNPVVADIEVRTCTHSSTFRAYVGGVPEFTRLRQG